MHENSVLNFIGIIIFLVLKESSCNSPRPFYRNNAEKFKNIAVTQQYVYIGGNSKIIQLNSFLKHQDELKMVHNEINYPDNWLLTVFKNETLIVCNYISEETHNSRCRNYKVEHGIDSFNSDQGSIRINHQSTRYLTTSVQNKNVLLIASSTCIRTDTLDTKCYAILSLEMNSLQKFNSQNLGFEYNVVYEGTNTGHVMFKTAFKVKEFVYFLFNTEDRHSKIGKMCTSSKEIRSNSYEDTPIACSHNNNNYTLAEDAVFWKEYLFVAFTDDYSSVICRYNLIAIEKNFMESRQDRLKCPYENTRNRYFEKQVLKASGNAWCFNKTSGLCHNMAQNVICPEVTDAYDGFCKTKFFGSVEGTFPIVSSDVIFRSIIKSPKNGAVVKLGVVPYFTHAIIHAGTSDGMIGQIFVTGSDQEVLDKFKTVQKSSPVLDIQVVNEDVYVMTQNMVVKVAEKKSCPDLHECGDCMNLTYMYPGCGWDILLQRCIKNPGTTTWWLPSLGERCLKLKVEDLFIADVSTGPQELKIRFKFEPKIAFYNVICWNDRTPDKHYNATREADDYFACNMAVRNEDLLRVGIKINNTVIDLAKSEVQLNECSALSSCKNCTRRGQCHWCLQTPSCVLNAGNCESSLNVISEEQQCPAINSSNVLIHQNKKEDLKINVYNIEPYKNGNGNQLNCVIDGESKDVNIEETKGYVECKDVKIKPPKLGNFTIHLKFKGSTLDGISNLEVYNCKDFGDSKKGGSCGYCKYKKTLGYKCDWCGSCKYECTGDTKCSISISKLEPSSGPNFGGTLVSLEGKNVGNQDDDITVTISGAKCTNVTVVERSKKISCITGNATGSSIGIQVTVNGEIYTAENIKYTYVGQHEIYGFSPNRSIIAGGKKIRIHGKKLIFPGSEYEIYYCNDSNSCLQCRLSKKNVKDQYMMCRMERSNSILTLKYLKIIIDKHTVVRKNGTFMMVGNPKLDLNAEIPPVFKSGGSKVTIPGRGFSNVGEVAIEGVEKLCTIKSNESVECNAPPYVESDFGRKKRATGQNANIHFDGYMASYTVFYAENPEFDKLTNVVEYEDGEEGVPIMIMGKNLLEGALQSDYTVKIGLDGTCLIQQISNWNITCLPPKSKPRTNHSDETIVFVVVQVGNIQDNLGNIRYITALPILPILIGVLGTALLVSIAVVITVVLASKRKRKGAEKKFQMELLVLEDKIRETSREEFADAQMTIRDIKSDLVTSRVPYCNYQSYAFNQLFPNQDICSHSLLFEPMVTDDNRRKVQKAMDMFDKLMTNKLFLKSLVQTLESQNKLTPQDKAQFASLLSVCLLGNMKLFYQLIDCLLISMIKAANKKQHKVLFRRFDTITQRLTVNWLALSLFDHLKKNGGMQLFMLYKATQTVIEKAPIDAITILCKNTLAEERLLKNRVEHEILTLDIDLNGNSDQRIPVIVLDCDTITQVKKKCCTAIYKNQPASEIPTPDELELEWHAGKSGKLTLQDIDNISDRSNGMIRLNTLKHYMVKNGSVMALMYKESSGPDDIYVNQGGTIAADDIEDMENQHVHGMVPTSTDHVKLLMPETAADNQDLKWHLSNLPDEEKSNKEHEIGEIFLNRLFHTKLILRDYIEACFEGITDSQSLSIPVRYFLCMIDKQGKEVGVDGDILQSWKSECYATRVWASLIAKPQILFDVNVPSHVEPCMDILKQVFIDSFTQCPQHVTKDASTQKLLFCKDIPEYRKNVNSFFIKVEAVNDQEFWKAMDEISSEQTKEMKFSRQATLHQLYKFIAKYKDEIIEDFQEKDETKDLAFGNKLEEVIDLMEEP